MPVFSLKMMRASLANEMTPAKTITKTLTDITNISIQQDTPFRQPFGKQNDNGTDLTRIPEEQAPRELEQPEPSGEDIIDEGRRGFGSEACCDNDVSFSIGFVFLSCSCFVVFVFYGVRVLLCSILASISVSGIPY